MRADRPDIGPERAHNTMAASASRPGDGTSMDYVLTVVWHRERDHIGASRVLADGESLVVGRGGTAFAPGVFDDSRVSRRHAEITREGRRIVIRDLGSRNRTRVNGHPVAQAPLTTGDVVEMGSVVVVLHRAPPGYEAGEPGQLVGSSHDIAQLLTEIAAGAAHGHPLLIVGDAGTGKELVAREIHEQSGREGPFIPVDCAAMAPSLALSELFGQGAPEAGGRVGLAMAADGGTLFLDEVASAAAVLQQALLPLLATGEVRPVGSDVALRTGARIIAASEPILTERAQRGAFAMELYDALTERQITVPPLRDRRQDILELFAHLVWRYTDRPVDLSQELAVALLCHEWPGNVRELASVAERAVAEASGKNVLALSQGLQTWLQPWLNDLTPVLPRHLPSHRLGLPRSPGPAPTRPSRSDLENQLIEQNFDVTGVAASHSIPRDTLYRWLRDLGIDLDGLRARHGDVTEG